MTLCALASEPTKLEPSKPEAEVLTFNRDIRPVLSANCFPCHGMDKHTREADLRLDVRDDAINSGAIVPGDSENSEVMVRLLIGMHGDEDTDGVMPPADSNKHVSKEHIETLRRWIDQGANYEPHWAFIAPGRPEVPEAGDKSWPRSDIDRFILARLEQEGMTPSPEADRETLIRRLSLDLIGLPPSIEEIEQFKSDKSTDAYEKLVDRLLASPAYGERWALWWLDIAHYADTNGYEIDRARTIWPYRDWVIKAFNSNMPYRQFVVEQLAGDLLPNATLDQRVATGFLRNTFFNEEGGHDPEQFRWESVVDRVNTAGTAFLGLTVACAQCHDHKYDPISHDDYYRFFAFFNNCDEPEFDVPQPAITAERNKIEARIAELKAERAAQYAAEDDQLFEAWCAEQQKDLVRWQLLHPQSYKSDAGATMQLLDDDSILVTGDRPEVDTYELEYSLPAKFITGIRLEAIPDGRLPNYGPGRGYYRRDGSFAISEFRASVRQKDSNDNGTVLAFEDPSSLIRSRKHTIANAVDGEKLTGWHAIAPEPTRQVAVFPLKSPQAVGDGEELRLDILQNFPHSQTIGRFRIYVTSDSKPLRATDTPPAIEQVLAVPLGEWSDREREIAEAYYVSVAPEFEELNAQIEELRLSMPKQPRTLVLEERSNTRPTKLHARGEFKRPEGEALEPNVPGFLPPLPAGEPRNRLTLARWMVDDANPLTRRVLVNQIWQNYFGRGLVNTSENFGSQGDMPSHPELLDWLCSEFADHGWDIKQLHRIIVCSATYRQSSDISEENYLKDQENVLLARSPRYRVQAELVRDTLLSASGLLAKHVGGPSVHPYQPASVAESAFQSEDWVNSTGDDQFRRGLYTFRKRGQMYPAAQAFDAPPQNICLMKRVRSITPLASLTLLNDETVLLASRAMAARVLASPATDDSARLAYAFRLVTSREPSENELNTLIDYLAKHRALFADDRERAETVVGEEAEREGRDVQELASWTMLSRVLLNLDETVSRP